MEENEKPLPQTQTDPPSDPVELEPGTSTPQTSTNDPDVLSITPAAPQAANVSVPPVTPAPNDPPHVTGENLAASSKKTALLTSVIVVVLVAAAGAAWYLYGQSKPAPRSVASAVTPKVSASPSRQAGPSVPSRLFDASADTNGVAVGYLAKPLASATGDWFAPTADAAGSSYQASVFYTKAVSGVGQIFALDVSSKASSQLTTDSVTASDPVFSSVSQNLAYMSSYGTSNTSGGRCDLLSKNLATGTISTVVTQTGNVCAEPIAWSPDGTKLLYASVDNVLTASDWGLVKLYVYQAGQPVTELNAPTGNNSLEGFADAIWTDSNTVEARFENKQQVGGVMLSQQLYQIDVKTGQATPITSPMDGDLSSIQTAGTDQYFATATPTAAVALVPGSGSGAGVKQAISGTSGAASFLLRFGQSSSSIAGIIFVSGQSGQQNAMKIESVPAGGGTATTVVAPSGYSAYLLGWAGNYDELLYMSVLSGQSDLRLYNLQTKTDSDLAPGLSLIQ